jgi:beta-lactam-binding protein with PASTA domain
LSARDALAVMSRLGLTAQLRGSGLVVEQSPAPGEPIAPGATVVLILERRVDRVATADAP